MRIARFSHKDRIGFGVVEGEQIAELDGPPIGELRFTGLWIPLADSRLLAPTLPSKIVAIGVNYADHASEMGGQVPDEPLMFLKPSTSVIGPGDPIRKPAICERLDHEGELAVVIGGLIRNADEDTAERGILGYTIGNDVTARDLQAKDWQWTRAKGFDSFCPLGPWIETDLDPRALDLHVRLNGEVRQHASTKDLFFPPSFLVSYISKIMTLLPGDVILTGTPAGVGPMEPGDAVEVEIEGIGLLTNPIEAAG